MELQWIGVAFLFGMVARRLGQPPLLGFLAAGFALELLGLRPDASLRELADVGILLLLFTIGLKLDLRTLATRHVLGPAVVHMAVVTAGLVGLLAAMGALSVEPIAGLDLRALALIAFALSFSSTVFAVKVLEQRDDMGSTYGRVAIAVLIVQDLVAVLFLAASKGAWPSPFAIGLIALLPLRPLLHRALAMVGHGELLVLAGLAAALGGAALFEEVGIKADLGALTAGVLLGGQPKSEELAKTLLGLKEVFLVGFFLSVGLTGLPTMETLGVGLLLAFFLPLKAILFHLLFTRFRLRSRTAFLGSVGLATYSEFGLIVAGVAVDEGWLPRPWVVTLAIAMGLSFLLASPVNGFAFELFGRLRRRLRRWERAERIDEERPVDASGASALVFGMGRVGTGAYDGLRKELGDSVVGFDVANRVVAEHRAAGRTVHLASATDAELWERLHVDRDRVRVVLLAMSSFEDNRAAIRQLRGEGYRGRIVVTARFADEEPVLREDGADDVFEVFAEAGPSLAAQALSGLPPVSPA